MTPNNTNELNVAFWNILFDVNDPSPVKSQTQRLPRIVEVLERLPKDTIIGLAEVEDDNGYAIASKLHSKSQYFVEHDRPGSKIGAISGLDVTLKDIQIDDNCRAIVAKYNEITVIAVHLTLQLTSDSIGMQQVNKLLSQVDISRPTVIMGDFNSMYWQGSRRLFKKYGFRSALKRSFINRIATAPTRNYRRILPWPLKAISLFGFTLDDIYVNGFYVLDSGVFEGESDHKGVWATLVV